jgi:glutaredoxin 3
MLVRSSYQVAPLCASSRLLATRGPLAQRSVGVNDGVAAGRGSLVSEVDNRAYAVLNKPIGREALLQAVRSAIAAAGTERPTRKVEIFSSGYCCSEKLITAIRATACPSCEVRVLDVTAAEVAERANQLGVQSVPAVAINDELVCCPCECGPDLAKLRVAGLGMPLS